MPTVYLLKHPTAGLYKIGRTVALGRRVDDVSKGVGGICEVVHLIDTDDAAKLEAELHRVYKGVRSAGEWFRLSDADVAAIRGASSVIYATLRAPKRHRRGVYRVRLPESVTERFERTAAALGISGDVLARKVVCACLTVFELRARKAETRRAADASWGRPTA